MPVLGQGGAVIQFVNTSGRPVLKKSSFEIEKGKHGVHSIMKVKLKQSRYRPGVAQRVPGS
jgi:hypothetical protein